MAYLLLDNITVIVRPEAGVLFKFQNPCHEGHHEESVIICRKCDRDFCVSCQDLAAVDRDYVTCPGCGWSWYEE